MEGKGRVRNKLSLFRHLKTFIVFLLFTPEQGGRGDCLRWWSAVTLARANVPQRRGRRQGCACLLLPITSHSRRTCVHQRP